jgi:hypothetical protein
VINLKFFKKQEQSFAESELGQSTQNEAEEDKQTVADTVQQTPEDKVTGIVLQVVHTIDGGYKWGSSTKVHLLLDVRHEGSETTELLATAVEGSTEAPLATVGDRVHVTFKDQAHGGRNKVSEFKVDFAYRSTFDQFRSLGKISRG